MSLLQFFQRNPISLLTLLVLVLVFLVNLLRWTAQRGKPRPIRTYNQGCLAGALLGICLGLMIGLFYGMVIWPMLQMRYGGPYH